MKWKIFSLGTLLGTLVILNCSQFYAQAETVDGQQKTSSIEVTMTEKTLALKNVGTPEFPTIRLTSETQKVTDTKDLSISVEDKRSQKEGNLCIYYRLSPFLNAANDSLVNQLLHLGKGNIQGLEEGKDYTSDSSDIAINEEQPLVRIINNSKDSYDYSISKSDISMTIDSNTLSGD